MGLKNTIEMGLKNTIELTFNDADAFEKMEEYFDMLEEYDEDED